MQKKLRYHLFIVVFFILIPAINNAQLLYFENFENCLIGNVGTDVKGLHAGQAGLKTVITGNATGGNSDFRIEDEPGRGKVLVIESSNSQPRTYKNVQRQVIKPTLDSLWDHRDSTNNVMMFEYYIYTNKTLNTANWAVESIAEAVDHCQLSNVFFDGYTKQLLGFQLPTNSWIKVITYVDYRTDEVFYQIPALKYDVKASNNLLATPLKYHKFEKYKFMLMGDDVFQEVYSVKYDDIKISAIKELPKFLNLKNHEATKFNIYPNPSNNILTISSTEHIIVEEIKIYDFAGKLVQTTKINQSSEIKYDISHLKAGTYMLHLVTKEGVSVEKIIKK